MDVYIHTDSIFIDNLIVYVVSVLYSSNVTKISTFVPLSVGINHSLNMSHWPLHVFWIQQHKHLLRGNSYSCLLFALPKEQLLPPGAFGQSLRLFQHHLPFNCNLACSHEFITVFKNPFCTAWNIEVTSLIYILYLYVFWDGLNT